jgi:hypothetical protein
LPAGKQWRQLIVTGAFAVVVLMSRNVQPTTNWGLFLMVASLAVAAFRIFNYLGRDSLTRRTYRRGKSLNLDGLTSKPAPRAEQAKSDTRIPTSERKEQRTEPRRGGFYVSVWISDAEARAEPSSGQVKNRSRGGLCLLVSRPVAVDTILSIRSTRSAETVPWVKVRVRRGKQKGNEWELGCKFEGEPSRGAIAQFG